jgi:hypothetical protein
MGTLLIRPLACLASDPFAISRCVPAAISSSSAGGRYSYAAGRSRPLQTSSGTFSLSRRSSARTGPRCTARSSAPDFPGRWR